MSSSPSSFWRRVLQRFLPFLFKTCPDYNSHWCWDRYCYCRLNEFSADHNGGVYDLKMEREISP